MKVPKAGGKSLKKYEATNLLFFLTLIAVLGILVTFVFHYYESKNRIVSDESKTGVISQVTGEQSDIGIFYLGSRISETSLQYKSRLEIPVTDTGLVRELFSLPGVDEVTINQRTIMIKKSSAVRWSSIVPGVHRIVETYLEAGSH